MKRLFTKEEIKIIKELRYEGQTISFIAKKLDRSYFSIYNKLQKIEQTKKKKKLATSKSGMLRSDEIKYMLCKFVDGYQIAENGEIYSIEEKKFLETVHLKGKLGKFVKIDDKYYNVAYLVCNTWKNAQDNDTIIALDGNPCNVDISNLMVKRKHGSPFEIFGA